MFSLWITASALAAPVLDLETARAYTDSVLEQMATARDLPITLPLAVEVRDRAGMREIAQAEMRKEFDDHELHVFSRVSIGLGSLPPGGSLEEAVLALLEQGARGLYLPDTDTLYLVDELQGVELDMVAGHEIVHGLQDMHFDVARLQEPKPGRGDFETARRLLVEGDAQAAWMAARLGAGLPHFDPESMRGMTDLAMIESRNHEHPGLVRSLSLPYTEGTATVLRVAKEQGWAAVDAMYDDLPTTSEQLLHYDKLLAREPAVAITVDRAPILAVAPGFEVIWEDEIGEIGLLAMLPDTEDPATSRACSAGWGGDRFVTLDRQEPGPVPLTVGLLAWDTEADAKEFEACFERYLERWFGDEWLVDREGDRVVFATGAQGGKQKRKLRKAAWAAFTS